MTQAKIVVQKGIPLPARRSNAKGNTGGRPMKYPFRTMQVGDSFEVKTDKPKYTASQMHKLAKNAAPERKIATRQMTAGTIRVWRIL